MADFLHTPGSNVKETILISKCNNTKLAMSTVQKLITCRPLSVLEGIADTHIFNNIEDTLQEYMTVMNKKKPMTDEMNQKLESGAKEEELIEAFRNADLEFIASGGYNAVYKIEPYGDIPIGDLFVLRMTKPSIREKKYTFPNGVKQISEYPNYHENKELVGLRYQALFSKHVNEGGFGCPNIGKVYDFGAYSDLNMIKDMMSEEQLRNVRNGKEVILENIPDYNEGHYSKPHTQGTYGIIEKINGGTLGERIDTGAYFASPIYHKHIIRNLLEALNCLHNNGLAHLDIKPENIMLVHDVDSNVDDTTKHTSIKLVDFGLSGRVNESTRRIVGTPNFISQYYLDDMYLRDDKTYQHSVIANRQHVIDYKDDIWSVGVVLAELTLNTVAEGGLEFLDFTELKGSKYSVRPNKVFTDSLAGHSADLHDFFKCIFRKYMDPTDESPVSTAEELLKHPWLAEVQQSMEAGGNKKKKKKNTKRKKIRSNKKSKQRKTKSTRNKKKGKK